MQKKVYTYIHGDITVIVKIIVSILIENSRLNFLNFQLTVKTKYRNILSKSSRLNLEQISG